MRGGRIEKLARFVLRAGIAFAFLYAAYAAYRDPSSWIGFFPRSLRQAIPEQILLNGWGIVEAALALWILSGRRIFLPSLLASFALFGLIITNIGAMDIIFRDVAILAATIFLTLEAS